MRNLASKRLKLTACHGEYKDKTDCPSHSITVKAVLNSTIVTPSLLLRRLNSVHIHMSVFIFCMWKLCGCPRASGAIMIF